MVDTQVSVEAVFFFDESGVCKEMMYPEFEAILDGVVGINEWAGDSVRASYVVINGQHQVESCVLFTISFDRQGLASKSWNLPLRHLVDTAGAGPNLGAGPIRLSCKSQCSVAWHHADMWDPDMTPANNTFVKIRDTARANKLCIPGSRASDPSPVQPVLSSAQQNNWGVASQSARSTDPFAPDTSLPSGDLSGAKPPQQVPPTLDMFDGDEGFGLMDSQLQALESEHRSKIASLLKAQRLHIKTLQSETQQKVAGLKLSYEKRLQKAEIEVARLKSQHESLHGQNIALREQNQAQRKQLDALKKAASIESREAEVSQQEKLDELKSHYQQMLEEKVAEETAKLKEDIELRNMELMYRHEVAKQLREELCELRKDKLRLVNDGGDKFLERLEVLGVSFIAFHPGAGHISIPLAGMPEYMDDPIGYAADKCLVSVEHYKVWLGHYERPSCKQSLSKDSDCNCKVPRVDVPSQFVVGDSDRCEKHKPHRGAGNIVSFGALNK